jgi:predicted transcriptional regulator
MLNIAASLLGPLEQSAMECFWASGPQTGGQILATLRQRRTIAHSTVTTTLSRLHAQGLLTRELVAGRKMPWLYTPVHASLGPLLAAAVAQMCAQLGADRGDRSEALATLLGAPR